MKPKKRFTPSWEIYNRILWDPKINQQAFYIGYEDRMIKNAFGEKVLLDWGDSDIPWSRVQYIRCEAHKVWDRANRIDLFESDNLPQKAFVVAQSNIQNTLIVQGVSIVNKAVFANNNTSAITAITPFVLDDLKVITFNVLTDKYDKELVQSHLRQPAIIAHLLEQEADILLLQEVDAPLLKHLLQANWGQVMYFSEITRSSDSYYQELLIVSKHPFSSMEVQCSKQKKFPVATWNVNDSKLHIANVHLTSNRAEQAQQIRQNQLEVLTSYLERLNGHVIIAGDFNCRGQEGLDLLDKHQFVDAWSALHPNKDGFTFEPSVNGLSKFLTLTGLPARFDRIYLQDKPKNCWKFEQATLFATEALDEKGHLFASDHYGLAVEFKFQAALDRSIIKESIWNEVSATYRSGIVIIPPKSSWEEIQAIRQQFDSKVDRWMPHITLLYGFLPERYFGQAAEELSSLMKEFSPFKLSLQQYQLFTQKHTTTAWLEPVEVGTTGSLDALQKSLHAHFFMKNSKPKDVTRFTPHLSIGQFSSREIALQQLPDWTSIDFEVGQLALISRQGNAPFKVRYTVELGTGKVDREHLLSSQQALFDVLKQHQKAIDLEHRQRQAFVCDLLEEVCSSLLSRPCPLYPLGSTAIGSDTKGSDMDLLCAIPFKMDPLIFLENVLEELEGMHESIRLVSNAQVPILKIQLEGIQVDLLCVPQANSFLTVDELQENHQRFFDAKSWQAISGVLEAQKLKQISQQYLSLGSFQWLVKCIKAWATVRGIRGNAFGFLGTYSWTVLACWACQKLEDKKDVEDLSVLLEHCFDLLAKHTWSEPISICESHQYLLRGKQDRMPILTSIKPYYNSARNVTQSTARILQQEFKRAATLIKKIKKGKACWEQLFEVPSLTGLQPIQLFLKADSNIQLEEYCGWIEGHVLSLIIGIEQKCGLHVRPYPSINITGLEASIELKLELVEVFDENILQECLKDFIASFGFDFKESDLTYKVF